VYTLLFFGVTEIIDADFTQDAVGFGLRKFTRQMSSKSVERFKHKQSAECDRRQATNYATKNNCVEMGGRAILPDNLSFMFCRDTYHWRN